MSITPIPPIHIPSLPYFKLVSLYFYIKSSNWFISASFFFAISPTDTCSASCFSTIFFIASFSFASLFFHTVLLPGFPKEASELRFLYIFYSTSHEIPCNFSFGLKSIDFNRNKTGKLPQNADIAARYSRKYMLFSQYSRDILIKQDKLN